MRKLLLTLVALISSFVFAEASHFAGGDLQYRYIGDSTGINQQYQFILRLYRDVSGIPMPNTVTLNICSSCFANSTISMPQIGPAQLAPTLFDCVDPNAPGTVTMEVYEYRQVATLPGLCSDYNFVTQTLNARNGAINNLSSVGNLVIEASLNNQLGKNSSPKFVSEPVRAFCVNKQFNWAQSTIEADGDSLLYRFTTPKGSGGTVCAPGGYGYNGGWSVTQPIRTVSGTMVSMNNKTGTISFTPSMQEVDVVAMAVEEYRFDSLYSQWIKIGESTRDMQITVSPTCSPAAQAGVKLDPAASYPDPINGLPTVDYPCLDSSVVLDFLTKLDCSTISPDGTDFRLTAPDGQPIPVKALLATCDVNNETYQITVKLHKPLAINGKYFLYSKFGNDGNTLLNKCGYAMDEFDTIQLNVTGCYQTNVDMKNVTIIRDEYPQVQWLLDTAVGYPSFLVDEYRILRSSDNGTSYNFIYSVKDYKNMIFNDQSLNGTNVDAQSYKYKVEVILNGLSAATSRDVHSIWLHTQNGQPIWAPADTVQLEWNAYNGWPGAEYTVTLGTKDVGGTWSYADHVATGGQINPTNGTSYNMINPSLQPGDYQVCVRANYPGGSGPYQAVSNCLPFTIYEPTIPPINEPTTVKIPNVITPNGDGNNDLFTIENIETWHSTRSVKIFNRWGNVVYQTAAYDNSNPWNGEDLSGKKLADGVYFYIVELYDQGSDYSDNLNGEVTIMTGG